MGAGMAGWHTRGMLRPCLALMSLPLALGLALTPVGRAHACGGMVLPEHSERVGGMREQEVLVVFQADRTVVLASAGYKGAGAGAAFLLPVRQNPLEIHEAAIDVFVALDELTAPEVTIHTDDGSGEDRTLGCGATKAGDAGGDLGNGRGDGDVMVLQRGTTASYEYEVVGGDTSVGVVDWLETAGYPLPPDYAAAIEPYVQSGYFFLAAKIKPGVEEGALPPLEVHLPKSEVEAFSIPFKLAAQSLPPGESLTITTYFAASGGVLPQGVETVRIDSNDLVAESPEQTNYQELYDEVVAGGDWVIDFSSGGFSADRLLQGLTNAHEAGRAPSGDTAQVQEFIDRVPFTNYRVTRVRTTLTAEQLQDLKLHKVEGDDASRYYDATFNDDATVCSMTRVGDPLSALLFPLLLVLRPRRRSGARAV
jgi:hypothetical protein